MRRAEWLEVGVFGLVILLLHAAGWGLFLAYARNYPAMAGLGLAAYLFGLRHGFDADHIAAVDDTTRYLLQKGRSPVGAGFFFSLGHSTVVFLLAVALALATSRVTALLPGLRSAGAVIGAAVSGGFLLLVALLNLRVLLGIARAWRQYRRAHPGTHAHAHLERMLNRPTLAGRLLAGRWTRFIEHGWHMYPIGLLFGLGFDTASEIALLATTAGASAASLPLPAVLSLPLLFAAGMSALDTADGVLMFHAYRWAMTDASRKVVYNLVVTGLSVVVALWVGGVELLQLGLQGAGLRSALGGLADMQLTLPGYLIVAVFAAVWIAAAAWRLGAGRKAMRGT